MLSANLLNGNRLHSVPMNVDGKATEIISAGIWEAATFLSNTLFSASRTLTEESIHSEREAVTHFPFVRAFVSLVTSVEVTYIGMLRFPSLARISSRVTREAKPD